MQEQLKTHMADDADNFYFMINPYFPTAEMFAELSENLPHLIRYYSSYQKVIAEKIKKLEGIDLPLIAVNGSCEAIRVFLQQYTKKCLVAVPNFNEWEITDHVPINYDASTDEVRIAIRENQVDTVCFCNPNNPTGHYREDIELLAAEFPEVRFAIDVSFIDFVDEVIPELPKGKNIVLFKSLGKNYGICGIRLGYIASEDEELIKSMVSRFPIWNINSVAEFLIDQIIEHRHEYEDSRIKIIEGTRKMVELLKSVPYLQVFPTKANFVMVKSEKPLDHFNVKSCDNKTGLDGTYYRFAYNKDYERLRELLG
ncbi:MAG: aminotransferase class I/II-fold pyridoxal phosphate-dependent enzyme [Nanoarchaeota archaeon]|nr:aminotransferase class I/II-fold pyridoxal phosphate-dependent enzyme [Nanoarchaeota archaeon]MBU1621983.1 aminotransferase class I/II-fold pyridoxal phosphate-dependent enzyme [Nanoarchaeota archaeon]